MRQIDDQSDLAAAFRQLTDRERALAVLGYFEDLTVREMADAFGVALGTVP